MLLPKSNSIALGTEAILKAGFGSRFPIWLDLQFHDPLLTYNSHNAQDAHSSSRIQQDQLPRTTPF